MDFSALLDSFRFLHEHIYLKRLVIMVSYAVIAKLVDLFIDRVLRRIAKRTNIALDDQIIAFLHVPICWTVLLFGVLHAVAVGPPLAPPWARILPAATKSIILVTWLIAGLRALARFTDIRLNTVVAKHEIGNDLFFLFKNVSRVVLVVAGLLWLLAIWEVDMTPLFASAGIAGIAIALAAKDTLANFFGGISIFADKSFKVGNYIILESGERGEVVEIGIRSTRIKTRDDILITVPNSILANSKIINESAPIPRFRIRIPVGVAYGSDLDVVERILLEVAAANPNVASEPEPRVRLRTFGESSVDFELLLWVDDPSVKGLETHKILKQVYEAFKENHVVIPFPQRDIHLAAPLPKAGESEIKTA